MRRYPFPSQRDALWALLRAPLLPAAVIFVLDAWDRTLQLGPLAIFGAALLSIYILAVMEVATLVIGGALLTAIWQRVPFHVLIFSVLGGLIACLPVLLLLALPAGNFNAWSDGHQTVIAGQKTAYGHSEDLKTLATVFGFGVLGGGFFWWLCRGKMSGEADLT